MAVTVSASKSNINSNTTAESSWITVYNSSGDLDWWYLQTYAKWNIGKSGSTYIVTPNFYIRVKTQSGSAPSTAAVLTPTALSGGSRTGFDTLGTPYVSISSKNVSAISTSQTNLGNASSANKDVSGTYSDSTTSGSLTYYIKLKITSGSIDDSVTVAFSFSGSFYGTKVREWNINYYENSDFGGDYVDGKVVADGNSYTVIKALTRPFDPKKYPYEVSFNVNGGTPAQESRDKSISQSITYKFNSWSGVSPGTVLTAHADRNFVEQYTITYGSLIYKTIGSLPTVYKKGYARTNEWYYSNGSVASASDEVKSSFTLHVNWDNPNVYNVSFNLNGGKLDSDYGKVSDYTISKTYGVNAKAPTWTPTRLGYTFTGWSDQSGTLTKVQPNGTITDVYYNAVATEYTNPNIVLYAQWTYKVNTVKCIYYLTDSGAQKTDTATYNIDTSTVDSDGDKAYLKYSPINIRDGDYVFLGWCDVIPKNWNNSSAVNDGYHGTYIIPPDKVVDAEGNKIDVELPIDLKIKNYKNLEDWGITETYYGIWAKSGKYININGWKKVTKAFVKIDGEWKTIHDMWTKQNNSWRHEI